MNILYILKSDNHGNAPLRYSLRSIAEYGDNVDRVFLVGDMPDFISDAVTYIPFSQPYASYREKSKNIALAVKYAIDNSELGEDFLVSMDDHFYCRHTDFNAYPYYCKNYKSIGCGLLMPDIIENGWPSADYLKILLLTRAVLSEQGLPYYNICPHRNMHVNRTAFLECWPVIETCLSTSLGVEPFAYVLNYMYAHGGFQLTPCNDIKFGLNSELRIPDDSECFSTYDYEEGSTLDVFVKSLYPNKSKYEI